MNVDDFRKMYVAELQELRSVEDQLVEALPRMAALVEHPQLRRALEAHLSETKSQRDRLDHLLRAHDAGNREHEDGSMHAIIREAERWAKMVSDRDCRDAGIVASAPRFTERLRPGLSSSGSARMNASCTTFFRRRGAQTKN